MSEVQDASFAIKAAEEAAAAGDFPTAEQYLSRAVELEELSSGPMHAELASILNNLGVVYERLNRPGQGGSLLTGARMPSHGPRCRRATRASS